MLGKGCSAGSDAERYRACRPSRLSNCLSVVGVESGIISAAQQKDIIDYLITHEVDVKRDDALLVIKRIGQLAESCDS